MAAAVRPPLRLFLLVLASCSLLLAACGGDDDALDEEARDTGVASSDGGGFSVAPGASMGQTPGGMTAGEAPAPSMDGPVGSDGTVSLPSVLGRTILRSGSVSLTVESVSDSFERVRQIAEGSGGFVADSSFYGSGEHQSASLTLRVPADQFGQVVADLRALAIEVESVQTSSQDVTEEFTDLQSTLRNLQAVEQQYLSLLSQAEAINDILLIQDRLSSVRLQVEQVQGRINMLDNLASLATLSVNLTPDAVPAVTEPGDGFGDRVAEAWESSLESIVAVGTGLAVGLVWSWWLLPVVVLAWLAWRRLGGRLQARSGNVDTPEASA